MRSDVSKIKFVTTSFPFPSVWHNLFFDFELTEILYVTKANVHVSCCLSTK